MFSSLVTNPTQGPDPGSYMPTLPKLGQPQIPEGLDCIKISSEWLETFGKCCEQGDVSGVLSLLIESSFASNLFKGDTLIEPTAPNDVPVYWRDALALTWDVRTFEGTQKIKNFLSSQLHKAKISNILLDPDHGAPELQRIFPDLVWIQLVFKFETEVGLCSGVARLVPLAKDKDQGIEWKAFTVFTNMDDLKGFPEKIGHLRAQEPTHGKWEKARQDEVKFVGKDPTVLIMGGGHIGLQVAARLKTLGVQHLIIEKNERIGDNWRNRYDALCLHSPVYSVHMPYIPFPPSWPVYTPAKKLANWLEHYADAMELNVWTSTTVLSAKQNADDTWEVKVRKADGSERIFHVKYIVFAVGFMGGEGHIPSIPGENNFKGLIMHSSQHKNAAANVGEKVVVVGSGSSGHDICVEHSDYGVDVTMFQRGSTYVISSQKGLAGTLLPKDPENGPPTATADLLDASLPILVASSMGSRLTKIVAEEVDKDLLDGLRKRGFRTNDGYKGCGLFPLLFTKGGSCYIDDGGSQAIIDGKIKLKSGGEIKEYFENGLRFEDGSELLADIVIFCTGFTSASQPLRRIFGDHVVDSSIPIWGLTEEGEQSGCYRDIGFPGLYGIMGNIGKGRFYSKHVALQIKAIEEGIFGGRYDEQPS